MAMLGDILTDARRSSGTFQSWLREAMPDLMAEIEAMGLQSGESTTDFVHGALTAFSQLASEEDWADLTSRMRDSADPGTVCLLAMVRWRLAAERRAIGVAAVADQGSGT